MPKTSKKKILVTEDDARLREILIAAFSKAGFEVYGAEDGKEGLKSAIANKPDLMIVDILMPKLDGLAMMKQIRKSSPWGSLVPIIILTNLQTNDNLTKKALKEELIYPLMVKAQVKIVDIIKEAKKLLKTRK